MEIYTDREGEVIFKKYSPMGELSDFAAQYAETLHRTSDLSVVICDRDGIVACAGVPRKEYTDKSISSDMDVLMQGRSMYYRKEDAAKIYVIGDGNYYVNCAMPILCEGDIVGCVASLESDIADNKKSLSDDVEVKLIQTAANFLGKQLET